MAQVIDGYCTLGARRETALTAQQLLREMDAAGVEQAVIAPEDHELAIYHAAGNERIAAEARNARGRFIPACTVSPWRGAEAVDLLRRAVDSGARLLVLAPAVQGFMFTDELADSLLAEAGQLGVTVYVHTGPHSMGGPTQVVLHTQRFGQTRFILAHGGSTDHAWDMGAILEHHRLDNVWYDLSLVRPWAAVNYHTMAGDRTIFASSSPRNDLKFELEQFAKHMPIDENRDFYGGNLLCAIGQDE